MRHFKYVFFVLSGILAFSALSAPVMQSEEDEHEQQERERQDREDTHPDQPHPSDYEDDPDSDPLSEKKDPEPDEQWISS